MMGNDYKFSTYIKQPQVTCSSNRTHPQVFFAGGGDNAHPAEGLAKIGTSDAKGAGLSSSGSLGRSPSRDS